jgi:hypothetical protein
MDDAAKPAALPVNPVVNFALGLAGAAAAGALGYVAFSWLAQQGFYGLALPGVLLGVGAGLTAQRRSLALAVVCGVSALALSLFAEWKHFPFIKDGSLGYFLSHLSDLRPLTLLMIALEASVDFGFPGAGEPSERKVRS